MTALQELGRKALKPFVPQAVRKFIWGRKHSREIRELRENLAAQFEDSIGKPKVNLLDIEYFRKESFPSSAGPQPWLDRADAEELIRKRLTNGELNSYEAEKCQKFSRNGYVIIEKLFSDEFLDTVWNAYELAAKNGVIEFPSEKISADDPFSGRVSNPHFNVPEMYQLLHHPELLHWSELLLGQETTPFQTISSHKGSQQPAHSDAIHMTTYPLGYMTAAWIACEDIHPDSGPVVYYPGSHKLPYYLSQDVGIDPEEIDLNGYGAYVEKYEPFVQNLIRQHRLTPEVFCGKRGDTFFWHHNLLHGGSKRNRIDVSRKSVVCHLFAKRVVCYHDINSSLARITFGLPSGQEKQTSVANY